MYIYIYIYIHIYIYTHRGTEHRCMYIYTCYMCIFHPHPLIGGGCKKCNLHLGRLPYANNVSYIFWSCQKILLHLFFLNAPEFSLHVWRQTCPTYILWAVQPPKFIITYFGSSSVFLEAYDFKTAQHISKYLKVP